LTASLPPVIARLAARAGPRAAAFDADGVLWSGDVSEDFTRWMIERGDFDGGLWASYAAVNDRDPASGCTQILQFYRGHELTVLRERVAEFWRAAPPRLWKAPVILAFRWLHERGFTMFVVSGTPRIVLEPLPLHLPVAAANILALELDVDADGRATGGPGGVVTCGPGKAVALRAADAGPILVAAGNSALDIDMLELADPIAWAIDPAPELRAHAQRAGWLIQDTGHGPTHG
jgi:phosphatidylglycerophosphatase C